MLRLRHAHYPSARAALCGRFRNRVTFFNIFFLEDHGDLVAVYVLLFTLLRTSVRSAGSRRVDVHVPRHSSLATASPVRPYSEASITHWPIDRPRHSL